MASATRPGGRRSRGGAGSEPVPLGAAGCSNQTVKGAGPVSVVSMKELLEAGVHFGHQTRRWNPKMKRFIFAERGGIYIIDLQKTLELLEEAHAFVRNIAERGGSVLFVGTKKQAQDAVKEQARARRHAVRQPPLARRPADELAHDLRAHRASPRAAPPEGRGPARAAAAEGADHARRRAREARTRTSAASPTCTASRTPSSSSTSARSSSPSARPSGSACPSSGSSTRTAIRTRPTTSFPETTTRSARARSSRA